MPITLILPDFDPFAIMDSGQCFRMVPLDAQTVEVIAFGERVSIRALGEKRFTLDCEPADWQRRWRNYFDMDTDYAGLIAAAPADDAFLACALQSARGLHILRQEPWETLCGFILSQRKHLKAIRAGMEALSDAFGEPLPGTQRRTFPAPAALAAQSETALRACGLGYRAPYVLDAAQRVATGTLDLAAIAALPDDALQAALLAVSGVGVKVADCVMLFAYARRARAPVDVWIRRVIDEQYGGRSPFAGYGDCAGVYQQFMFMHRRDGGR